MNAQTEIDTIQHIKLTDLKPDPHQPRKYFDEEALQALADDIAVRGIIEPIIYFIDADGANIIFAGERRYRAAKLAGLQTVPCLQREGDNEMERLFDQVSENFQREGLDPIEMASFFDQLVKHHKIKPTQIPDTLSQYGLKKFDRSYISNIRRLLQLPDWAQLLIHQGRLSASHGKYLLPAVSSDKVMDDVKTFLEKQEKVTVDDVDELVRESFDNLHLSVAYGKTGEDGWAARTAFDYAEACKGCKTRQCFNRSWGEPLIYCLNETCYDEKQAAAVKEQEAKEARAQKAAETRKRNAMKKEAEDRGVTLEELEQEEQMLQGPDDDSRARGRIERTQQYLDNWLRIRTIEHLSEDEATRYQLVLYMAAGAPGDYGYEGGYGYTGCGSVRLDLTAQDEDHGIDFTLKPYRTTENLEMDICEAGLKSMSRKNLRTLAHHCGIKLEGNYYLDHEYLDIKLKDEIIQSTPAAVIEMIGEDEWKKVCNCTAGYLKGRIVNHADTYGVPADLVAMYSETADQ